MSLVKTVRRPPLRLVELDTGKRNILSLEAIEDLTVALTFDAEAPVVVLRGRTDGFCSGLDNATLAKGEFEREEILAAMGELLLAAISGPTRIVAVCEGHAVAAGAMLLLVSDLRIGVRGAYKIGFTEPRLGMPLPVLPALLARERLDRRRLHELTALGRILDPDGAASAGFLDSLTQSADLESTVLEAALELAALGEAAYQRTVAAVWGPTIEQLEELVGAQARRRDAARASAG